MAIDQLPAKPGDAICQTHSDAHLSRLARLLAEALCVVPHHTVIQSNIAVCRRPPHETSLRGPGSSQCVGNSVDT
jgi:hypothetical protein